MGGILQIHKILFIQVKVLVESNRMNGLENRLPLWKLHSKKILIFNPFSVILIVRYAFLLSIFLSKNEFVPERVVEINTESCPSGRRCETRNFVLVMSRPRVRIPNSPPYRFAHKQFLLVGFSF